MRKFFHSIAVFTKETDKLLLLLCLALSGFGVLMVYSATRKQLTDEMLYSRDVRTMVIAIAIGLVLCLLLSYVDYNILARLWPVIAIACFGIMCSLFVFGVAPDARSDAKSWLKFGSFYFQPSELLKIGFTITFAVHIDAVRDNINKIKNVALLALHAGIAIGLVVVTGDLGSALVFICMTVGMLFVAGLRFRYFIAGLAAVGCLAPIVWYKVFSDIQRNRFLAVYHPSSLTETTYKDVIYQQQYGMQAIGSGGIKGQGLFNGTLTQSTVLSVPESQNDMIFSVVGEELGFIGCIAMLAVMLLVIIKIFHTGKKAMNFTGKLICFGVAFMIASQIMINIGMCLKILPVIGITLPFISSGGSSNLCVYLAIGLVLNVYRASQEREPGDIRDTQLYKPFAD